MKLPKTGVLVKGRRGLDRRTAATTIIGKGRRGTKSDPFIGEKSDWIASLKKKPVER